jgi:SPOR domain/PilZ domain
LDCWFEQLQSKADVTSTKTAYHDVLNPRGRTMIEDRRQHPRLIPDSALLVSVDRFRRTFLYDLSEGGMAFDGMAPEHNSNVISLSFDLPDGGGAINALAEVMWTCESRHRTGIRFLELADECRERLREWLSSRVVALEGAAVNGTISSSLGEIGGAAQKWILQEIGAEASHLPCDTALSVQAAAAYAHARRPRLGVAAVMLGLVVFCSAFVTLGYYLPGMAPSPKSTSSNYEIELPIGDSPAGSIKPVGQVETATLGPGDTFAKYEGFVLQVGAMAHEANAVLLARKLREQNFPAFVFNHGNDGLYRVDVGPYDDAGYAHGVKSDLTGAGFRNVLERQLSR